MLVELFYAVVRPLLDQFLREADASNAGGGHGLAAERIARGFQARLNRGRAELAGLPMREVQAVSLALFRESAGDMDRKYL